MRSTSDSSWWFPIRPGSFGHSLRRFFQTLPRTRVPVYENVGSVASGGNNVMFSWFTDAKNRLGGELAKNVLQTRRQTVLNTTKRGPKSAYPTRTPWRQTWRKSTQGTCRKQSAHWIYAECVVSPWNYPRGNPFTMQEALLCVPQG